MNEDIKIIDTIWYGSMSLTTPAVFWWEAEHIIVSWAVLIWNWFKFRAYIWVSNHDDETLDAEEIVKWWNCLPHRVALAIFDNVHRTFDWEEVTLKSHYRT